MFILTDAVLAATFFDTNEDFVGEIVSERFSVLRHKFCKGDLERRNKLLKIK